MAIIKHNGRYSGSIGATVFSSWRDLQVVKSKPKSSKKPVPPAKKAANGRFGMASRFLSSFRPLLNIGYAQHRVGSGDGYHAAMRQVLTQAIKGAYPNYYIHYPSVRLSAGGLEAAEATLELSDGQFTLRWSEPQDPFNCDPGDEVFVLLFLEAEESFVLSPGGLLRRDGQWSGDIPGYFSGSALHCWLFFRAANGRRCSETVYLQDHVPGSGDEGLQAPPAREQNSVLPILAGVVQPVLKKQA